MRITDESQIDLQRVVIDPEYRRAVTKYLNTKSASRGPRAADAAGQWWSNPRPRSSWPQDV